MNGSEPTLHPTGLSLEKKNVLLIQWSNDTEQRISVSVLRDACPCATCREKKRGHKPAQLGALPVLSAAETLPLSILAMRPVGQYAYNIKFSDGHGSGIYSFDLIQSLG